jgi:hypothetical protein
MMNKVRQFCKGLVEDSCYRTLLAGRIVST